MASKKKKDEAEQSQAFTWDMFLQTLDASAVGVDATAMPLEDGRRIFAALDDEEAKRIEAALVEAVTNIDDAKELIATVVDIISSIKGVTLRLTR